MKNFLIILMISVMLFSVGCFLIPDEPIPEPIPDPDIICVGGYYAGYYSEWSFTGCPDDPWYAPGVYWFNKDGRVFLIGDNIWPELAITVYGKCPTEYVEEIFKGKEYLHKE